MGIDYRDDPGDLSSDEVGPRLARRVLLGLRCYCKGRTSLSSTAVVAEDGKTVDPESTLFDADLDTPRQRPPAIPADSIAACQRFIVNPFLALLGWLAAAGLIRYSLQTHNPALHLTALLWLFVPFLLIQYHCLDCRTTGWYLHSRRHICPGVFTRWSRGGGTAPAGPESAPSSSSGSTCWPPWASSTWSGFAHLVDQGAPGKPRQPTSQARKRPSQSRKR